MGPRQDREPDDVHVLLDRRLDDLLGRPLQPGVDHLDPGVTEGVGDDLGPAIVTIEPGLGDEDLHDTAKAGSQRAPPRGSSETFSGARRTRWPILSIVGSAPCTIEKMRWAPTLTMAKTRGPSKPAGKPASCAVKAWIVPSVGRSTQAKRSLAHSGQKARGGHAVRPQPAHSVVHRRPAARRV